MVESKFWTESQPITDKMTDKPEGRRSAWRQWVMVALLIYLWGWLVALALANFIDERSMLGRTLLVIYWPLIKLGELSAWPRHFVDGLRKSV
jgi:hypothetical protein